VPVKQSAPWKQFPPAKLAALLQYKKPRSPAGFFVCIDVPWRGTGILCGRKEILRKAANNVACGKTGF